MSMGIHRDEDLDDAVYQTREVYAQYGRSMYYAQVLEHGLVNALSFAQIASDSTPTRETLDFNFDRNTSATMGLLLNVSGGFWTKKTTWLAPWKMHCS